MTPAGLPLFQRVLVANRGEIAVRIIRACRELGIEAIAVHSDVDSVAMHTRLADASVRIGPASPTESYLRIDAIVTAALASNCQAVHPGYGFLSEQAAFAEAVTAAGLAFVGPPASVLDALGDKLHARRLASRVGVPVVPGTLEPARPGDPVATGKLIETAARIGFPILVKAAAGGGGRGMRRVTDAAGLPAALTAASSEAAAAFGDGSVYLEREVQRARHVEVQLLGDHTGRVVAVGERDCSIQRRHQKLVEEAPAPGLGSGDRRRLHEMAVAIGREAGLSNAATAEFLLTPEGEFHFLEVNTRLQVEHGITELVSGVDLVHEQLRLAAGQPISPTVEAAAARAAEPGRHAIEVRLTAEDPGRDFAPTPGLVQHWSPPAGPGVRVDSGIESGAIVPPEYDNLVAKIMVVAADRPTAIRRLARALDETEITGIQTTLPFHRHVATTPSFVAADLSTRWVEEQWDGPAVWQEAARRAQVAAGLLVHQVGTARGRTSTEGGPGAGKVPDSSDWRLSGRRDALQRWPR